MKELLKLLATFIGITAIAISCTKEEPTPEPIKYTLTVTAGDGGNVSSTGGSYAAGSEVTITATPNSEYVFSGWSNGSTDNPIKVTVNSNQTLTANFTKRKYALSITIEGEGTVTEEVISSGKDYDSGTVVRLTAVPSDNWQFNGWTGAVESTELSIDLTISEAKSITAEFVDTYLFVNIPSEYFNFNKPYSDINLTSGTIADNFFVPKIPTDSKWAYYVTQIIDNSVSPHVRYQVRRNSYRYFDFNQDGKTDMFFYRNRYNGNYFDGRGPGQLGIVDDIHGHAYVRTIETDRVYQGWVETNDFDGDGVLEFIVYGNEDHNVTSGLGGVVSTKKPLSYVDVSPNGSITMKRIGNYTSSHDITSGDIDNDGDIDIINFEWWMNKTEDEIDTKQVPLFYINDGSGNFTTTTENMIFEDRFYQDNQSLIRMATDMFDLNNDGYLDIVMSGTESTPKYDCNGCGTYETPIDGTIQVVWGSSTGVYDYRTATHITQSGFLNPHGYNFVDMNNDGFYDIISISLIDDWKTAVLSIHMNNGDRTFGDRIEADRYKAHLDGITGWIGNTYGFQTVDLDGDGDLDLRNSFAIDGGAWYENMITREDIEYKYQGPDLYWENINGTFVRHDDFLEK